MEKIRVGLVASIMALAAMPVAAETYCADRDRIVTRLASAYGEAFAGGGLRDQSSIVEVWVSEGDGTWTVLMTRADGTTCVMASGTNWRAGLPADAVKGVPG